MEDYNNGGLERGSGRHIKKKEENDEGKGNIRCINEIFISLINFVLFVELSK